MNLDEDSNVPFGVDAGRSTLARLRHDLRTPLNQIIGYSELLIETVDEHTVADLVAPLKEVHRAGIEMLAKLNDELAPWKMESGQVSLVHLQRQLASPLLRIDEACARSLGIAGRTGAAEVIADLTKIGEAVRRLRNRLDVSIAEQSSADGRPRIGPEVFAVPPPVEFAARDGKGRLLVVDDDSLNREMIARRLEHMGFKVVLAANGLEALAALRREPFDLVMLDILMPELDGFSTLERIKANPQWQNIPVVMLTALDDADSTARCISAGAEDYVPKPFNPVVLRARINASLEKKRLHDQEQNYLARIQQEQAKSEQLLLSILPSAIATRLKSGERQIVDAVPAATVLFADIVGFTAIAAVTPPDETVALLNELFSAFDTLVDDHGLEKIKTIGDAYMAVAGVPRPVEDHADRGARMALAMLAAVRAFNERHRLRWSIRIGMHSGPLMAGIIGSRKFAYDLWGDTVNLASRLEAQGEPDRIHLSGDTAALIRDRFAVHELGLVSIRNRGEVPVYRLDGRLAD